MATTNSKPNPRQTLAKAREITTLHQAMTHHLLNLQSQLAGLLPRSELNRLYLSNEISPEEYIEILIGSGYSGDQAHESLVNVHDGGAPEHWTRPEAPKPAIDWSTLGRPGRKPTRPAKADNETLGHPLEGLE